MQNNTKNNTTSNQQLGWKMVAIASGVAIISLYFNISFGASLGIDSTSRLSMGGFYLLADLAKLIALVVAGFALSQRHFWQAAIFIIIFIFTVSFSLISSTAFMATLLDTQQTDKLTKSDGYQDHRNAKTRAQTAVESTAISSHNVDAAKRKAKALKQQQQAAKSAYDSYNSMANYPTATRQALSKLNAIDNQLSEQQKIINQGAKYQGALINLERLENKNIKATSTDTENAGFGAVALALGLDVDTFTSRLFLLMAIAGELITTSFFTYVGFVFGDKKRVFSHSELIQMQAQLIAETEQQNDIKKLFLSSSNTHIVNHDIHPQADIDPENVEQSPTADKQKRVKGEQYTCAETDCVNLFTANNGWHKFCSDCRQKKDRKVIA
ncbi:MAG: hypothetical protein Q9M28_02720 [Mariprofundaceae bacterium]|nr:hypothetical protein [Mariprofundaceae bacterium]